MWNGIDYRVVVRLAAGIVLSLVHQGCTVGPDYMRPSAPESMKYKELKGWKLATPIDDIDRGAWWSVFKDPKLDELERQVEISNQTIALAEAAYRQARALIKEAQAGLFPTVTANYDVTGTHTGSANSGTGVPRTIVTSTLAAEAAWDIDVWGKVRRSIESSVAGAQLSAADLANTALSAQATLALAYFNLRASDALETLLDKTAAEYKRTLEITQNQFAAGTVSKADVATAQTQLLTTEAQAINVGVARAQFEHAIAALIGKPPADLTISKGTLANKVPNTPVGLPSALLERRPDIAAAERMMQQVNAQIGVAVAAYYPDISLTGMLGFTGRGALAVSLAHEAWTIGASVIQVAFDAGLRDAQVEAARAIYDQSVASYRQTVLTAFQQVEDQLAALRIFAKQAKVQDDAVKAAREEVTILLNQYRAGTVVFTAVVVAEAMLLSNEITALSIRQSRFLACVSLIEALGGGWDSVLLPSEKALIEENPLIPK